MGPGPVRTVIALVEHGDAGHDDLHPPQQVERGCGIQLPFLRLDCGKAVQPVVAAVRCHGRGSGDQQSDHAQHVLLDGQGEPPRSDLQA